MSDALRTALTSLEQFPDRAPLIESADGLRELRVPFGRYGYAIHYAVEPDAVLVVHIFHVREAR